MPRIDNTAAPKSAPRTRTILAEVAKMITNPVANGYYPVYIDQPRGHAGYCAWHSWGTVQGETVTDPNGTGWFDVSGAENADKCAWTFSGTLATFSNSTQWKIQGNYSNAAAAVSSGYDFGGCIDGN